MSAKDELRRMLDERGVEWWETWDKDLTIFDGAHGVRYMADHTLGEWFIMSVLPITAEQVIAATLGEPVDADLRKALDFMRIWISEDAHLGESAISYKLEKAEGLRKLDTIEDAIAATLGCEVNGDTSDGYHTFDELYYHRTALFACLVALQPRQMAFKSWKHSDGTMYEGMFIAGIYTSRGWCTYHCEAMWWPLFDCHEQEFAPEWDGHTPSDAIHRLMSDFLPSQEVGGEVSG